MTIFTRFVTPEQAEAEPALEPLFRSVYIGEKQWIPTDSKLFDEYHPHSRYCLLKESAAGHDRLLGAARLVFDGPLGLPVERFFRLGSLKRAHRVAEIQRLMIEPALRSRRHREMPLGPLARVLRDLVQHLICDVDIGLIFADLFDDPRISPVRALQQLGFQQVGQVFQDSELACPVNSVVMSCDPTTLLRTILENPDHMFIRYLLKQAPQIAECPPEDTTSPTERAGAAQASVGAIE